MENEHFSTLKKTAGKAGILYAIWVLTGIYTLMYVSAKTIVPGDAGATAKSMLSNEWLFRSGIIVAMISNIIWIFIAQKLYGLFYQINERRARLLVSLVLVQIPVLFISEGLNLAALKSFKGEILQAFNTPQRQSLAMAFLQINNYGTIIQETFWGLWLFPFGQLVYKSGFIPKIWGVFLIVNGAAYVLHSFVHILFPVYQGIIYQVSIPVWTLGEIGITLWLLIKGVRKPAEPSPA